MISFLNCVRRNNLTLGLVFTVYAFTAVAPVTQEGDKIAVAPETASSPLVYEIDDSRQLSEPSTEKGLEGNQIDSKADENFTRTRLISTGIAGGGVLSVLVVLFSYFRLNHATRGFYSRRLQMGAASLAILIVLACYFLIVAFN